MSFFPQLDRQLTRLRQESQAAFDQLNKRLDKLMADTASILAKVTKNTDILKSIQAGITAASEGQIKALKDQIAAGQAPDFTALDAAVDEQGTLIGGLAAAIPANT